MRLPWCLVLLCIAGCPGGGEKNESPSEPVSVHSTTMPVLRRMPLTVSSDVDLIGLPWTLAVSADGEIAFPVKNLDNPVYVSIDSTGRVVGRLAHRGEGPHESVGAGGRLFGGDSTVMMVDPETRQALIIGFDGTTLVDKRNLALYLTIARSGDSVLINREFRDHANSYIESMALGDNRRTQIVGPNDSLLRLLAHSAKGAWPAAAWHGDRLVLGEGYTYTLALYRPCLPPARFGRTLPPRHRTARELAEARAEVERTAHIPFVGPDGQASRNEKGEARIRRLQLDTLPYFTANGGLAFDGAGRLWVVGQANDSTFADIYADTTLVGRIMIECRDPNWTRPVSLHARWLAMACLDPDEIHRLRLYTIEG